MALKMAQPVERPKAPAPAITVPVSTAAGVPDPEQDPENYQQFLARAEAEEARRTATDSPPTGSDGDPANTAHMTVTIPAPLPIPKFRFTPKAQALFYGMLAITLLLVVSTIAALAFLVIDARNFGPTAGHIIWFVLSLAFALVMTTLFVFATQGRRSQKLRWRDEQAIEMTNTLQHEAERALAEAREREIQREALERTARRSLHSAQESERDVRFLTETLSEHGVPNPIANTDDNLPTPTHWEDDLHPMTKEERLERRQAREALITQRRLKDAERSVKAGPSSTAMAPELLVELTKAAIMESRERFNKSRENVGGWMDKQSLAGDDREHVPDSPVPETAEAEGPVDNTLVGSQETSPASRSGWKAFPLSKPFMGHRKNPSGSG